MVDSEALRKLLIEAGLDKGYYKLVNRKVVATDIYDWMHNNYKDNRHIIRHTVLGRTFVSTVFLGMDQETGRTDYPVVFETKVFGGNYHTYQWRYCFYGDAIKGHEEAVVGVITGRL